MLEAVGKDYEVVQNTDAFNFFDAIVGGDGIQDETAGTFGKGERTKVKITDTEVKSSFSLLWFQTRKYCRIYSLVKMMSYHPAL